MFFFGTVGDTSVCRAAGVCRDDELVIGRALTEKP